MSTLDPKVASIVDGAVKDDESDEDALIATLENDTELDAFREQRLQQLHAEYSRAQQLKASNHGSYTEIKDERALMDITTSTKQCIVHFFKPDFNRCRIMDTHLESLASSHYEVRILRINVENCPFLVTRLDIKVLPCVISFMDGMGVDRIIGFEGLGRAPGHFTTRNLEARLIRAGVLIRDKIIEENGLENSRNCMPKSEDEHDGDWDN